MSVVKVDSIQTTSGIEKYTISAYANYTTVTSTQFIGQKGFSSITDYGTGDSMLTLSNAFSTTGYSVVGMIADVNNGNGNFKIFTASNFAGAITLMTTTQFRCGASNADSTTTQIQVIGD